jgi:opacity protein-like surface antigen
VSFDEFHSTMISQVRAIPSVGRARLATKIPEEGEPYCHEIEIWTCPFLIFGSRLWPGWTVYKLLCESLAMITLVFCEDARAADSLTTSPGTRDTKAVSDAPAEAAPRADWTGFYVGANAGVSSGRSAWSATQPGGPNLSGSLNFFAPYDLFNGHGSHFGGLSGGYNYELPSRVVVGLEADVSFPGSLDASQSFSSAAIGSANYEERDRRRRVDLRSVHTYRVRCQVQVRRAGQHG